MKKAGRPFSEETLKIRAIIDRCIEEGISKPKEIIHRIIREDLGLAEKKIEARTRKYLNVAGFEKAIADLKERLEESEKEYRELEEKLRHQVERNEALSRLTANRLDRRHLVEHGEARRI